MVGTFLPMFPLGTVLFPYAPLALHVFEPRYRLMMRHVLEGDRSFGVVLIERGSEVGGGDVRFDTGTIASLVRAQELPDGRWQLATVGVARLRVVEWLPDDPYPHARVAELPDATPDGNANHERDRVLASLRQLYHELERVDPRAAQVEVALADDPVRASYEAARLTPMSPLDAQRLLEIDDAVERLRAVDAVVRDRLELIREAPSGGDL